MKPDRIWLDVDNFQKFEKTDEYKKILDIKKQIKLLDKKFEKTDEYKKILDIKKQIKLLEKQVYELTMEVMKKHNIKFSIEK